MKLDNLMKTKTPACNSRFAKAGGRASMTVKC